MNVHHGGSFTPKGGREYVLGNISFVDLLDIKVFSVHTVDDIVKQVRYSAKEVRYYHFMITILDYGLAALASDQDVVELLKYVPRNKLTDLYIEHGTTTLDKYYKGPRDGVIIEELDDSGDMGIPTLEIDAILSIVTY
ncbi:hypothetical protein Tco_0190109 [Tanacetum coccineum]